MKLYTREQECAPHNRNLVAQRTLAGERVNDLLLQALLALRQARGLYRREDDGRRRQRHRCCASHYNSRASPPLTLPTAILCWKRREVQRVFDALAFLGREGKNGEAGEVDENEAGPGRREDPDPK